MLMLIDDANNRLKRDYVVPSGVLHTGERAPCTVVLLQTIELPATATI